MTLIDSLPTNLTIDFHVFVKFCERWKDFSVDKTTPAETDRFRVTPQDLDSSRQSWADDDQHDEPSPLNTECCHRGVLSRVV